ncbi:MAG: tol-pal system protein YbgF [Candidatus Rokubacteria bacterium RIFCSPHIGHO2_12_FULL_73_22]|nr:MAG: tol-pal system protein YbgF [Candidatus Rokubacteria bacterium RIFCSPHIGHO2_12_FULL_73_22]OGL09347.1 MAG: tol-pal system protein YbgF [Candidatus Rokubacteria bacterium RIFCSPLOWO2_02_FULL_73_56]OGL29192.1 MAG: tol-pal system protein YbgF [Candidatus Rokubacteria bacterium RIFCSPLOWO2_12_FULL_73_47]
MNRALGVAAVLALLASGCASRGTVSRLAADVERLRTDLTALRASQETTARDVTRARNDLAGLDARLADTRAGVRTAGEEIVTLSRRLQAAEAAIGEARARVQALVTPPAPAAPRPAPAPERSRREPPAARLAGPEQAYAAALAAFRAREHGQAVLDLLDFLAKYPRHPLAANAQYWIGEAYYVQHDYRQALVEFERVLEHGEGKAADALLKIGLCYLNLRDARRAHQAWMRVLSEYPRAEAAGKARVFLRTHAARRR